MEKENLGQRVIPDEKSLHGKVEVVATKFASLAKEHSSQLGKSIRRHAYTEAYLLAWTLVESTLLPGLILQTAHDLGMKDVPNLKEKKVSTLIDYYYFLSQDLPLYRNLQKANTERGNFMHIFNTVEDITSVNKRARVATRYLLESVTPEILNRLISKEKIPVLNLYSRGWNDCRNEVKKRLARLKKLIKADI